MSYNRIVISSGHGKYVRGASGILDEVDEARKVVDRVAKELQARGVDVKVFHDDTSKSQDENLRTIVDYHNTQARDLDISVHFNAYEDTTRAMGTEVLYVTQEDLAEEMSAAISFCGFIDRGPKERNDLYFLNNTEEPAILIETCFVDSTTDAEVYQEQFENICKSIANVLRRPEEGEVERPAPLLPPFTAEQRDEIFAIVHASNVWDYPWKDRGLSPVGYSEGMAIAFATVVCKYLRRYDTALEMAKADTLDPDLDALTWYGAEFTLLKMDNSMPGLDTLRHLWVLLYGLGMRESSGQHCEGRDMSADNVSADTAEAGLFQMSWNARGCHEQMQKLMDHYQQDGAIVQGAVDVFREGVSCSQDDWTSYGTGDGAEYQIMAKELPAFACETAAIGLRNLRQHWGPINRREVEVRPEVDDMLREVQELFVATPKGTKGVLI